MFLYTVFACISFVKILYSALYNMYFRKLVSFQLGLFHIGKDVGN